MGIETAFMPLPGQSRRCLTFIEQDSPYVSEVLERGIEVPPEAGELFLSHVRRLADRVDMGVVSGSLPPGLPVDYYERLIHAVHDAAIPAALDSSGEPFRRGLEARPELIKPNLHELAEAVGQLPAVEALIAYARKHVIGQVLGREASILLSLGEEGAALITHDRVLRAVPAPLHLVNPVGAGDAMLAGFLHARSQGIDNEGTLLQAVAFGSAAALQLIAGVVDPEDIERLRRGIQVYGEKKQPT